MQEPLWQALSLVASFGVAGATAWLAFKTKDMADAAKRQLDWYADRDRASLVPRVLFPSVFVRQEPEFQESGRARLLLEARGMANLGPFSIYIEEAHMNLRGRRLPVVFTASQVITAGRAWPEGGLSGGLADSGPIGVTGGHELPAIHSSAESLDILFRNGADTKDRWRLRLYRVPSQYNFWLEFTTISPEPELIQQGTLLPGDVPF